MDDPDLFARVFPMDLRPQGHDIIRTWLFSTVVRAHLEEGSLPWRNVALSGWILDPDRKKMSKSKGNVVTPMGLLERFGTDAVRYWAASARPGVDTAFDEGQMKVGRKLAVKVLNATKFVLGLPDPGDAPVSEPVDRSLLVRLAELVDAATVDFEAYDYARALERTEQFFWSFCDDHLELVKGRAYASIGTAEQTASANAALRLTLDTLLRLFSPFLPFVTDEVWSWWRARSRRATTWPEAGALREVGAGAPAELGTHAASLLAAIRKAKTEAKRSMRWEVTRAVVRGPADLLAAVADGLADVAEAGNVAELVVEPGGDVLSVEVQLAEEPPTA